ncbi:bacterial Ig-like domain-containing protein [Desulfosporosinus sp. FKB]|uniref:bacterial Ig-like domain-containing protein n=1 Tax=Desulfosporosinus sp. FKB TaxID=1969835 RepID=UPI0014839C28|nr:bacterial Ig-like domain-containing protein [Desulfosporosinus sp. FKB]
MNRIKSAVPIVNYRSEVAYANKQKLYFDSKHGNGRFGMMTDTLFFNSEATIIKQRILKEFSMIKFKKRKISYIFVLIFVLSAVIMPNLAYGAIGNATVSFTGTDTNNVGSTLHDGSLGSTDISGIQLDIFNANRTVPDTPVEYFGLGNNSSTYDSPVIIPNYDPGTGIAPDFIVIKSDDGSAFDFKSIYVLDYLASEPQIKFEGFRNGISTGSVILNINQTDYQETFTSTNGLTPSIFQNIDEVRISNQYDGDMTYGNYVGINNIQIGDPPDVTNPTAGNSGTIIPSNATSSSVDLSWAAGSDNVTAAANLQYKVIYSTSNNLGTVTNAEANGTVAQDWSANLTDKQVTGLSAGTTYYFNVLIKDEAGNESVYTTATQVTTAAPVALQSIAITTPATKLIYTAGDSLDISGMVVTGTYSDNSTKTESITAADVSGFDSSAPEARQTLTVTVGGKSTTYTIEIQAAPVALQSIAITTPAAKLIYTVGDSLDISGMVVTGTYSDNSTKTESITAADVSGFDSSAPETSQTLTVTVGGKSTTYTVEIQAAPVALQSIAITTPAAKLIYTVGDSLDISGMVVTGTYSDNSTKTESITAADVSGFDSRAPETSPTLTVTVGGKSTTYTVEIQAAPVALQSIAITTPAAKLIYTVGDSLDISGMVVTGTYSDNSTKTESITAADVSGFDSSAPEASQTLTVTVGGKSTTYTVEIQAAPVALQSIAITTPAAKLIYTVGDSLDISGMVVTGTYSDNSTKTESITAADVSGFDSSAPEASQTLTVTVGGKTTTYTIEIQAAPVALQSIAITTPAAKLVYPVGASLGISGMIVTGTYRDNSTKTESISAADGSGFDSSAPAASQTLTVTVGGKTPTDPIAIQAPPVALQSIAITTPAAKLIYTVGDSLHISGMVVTGTYSDNNTKTESITTADVSGFDSSAPEASQTLTVTVGGKTTTYTIEIQAAPVALQSIAITTPAAKLIYTVGDSLDISGMIVTGTYSDNSTKTESISAADVSGFDSSAPEASQTLTVTVGGKSTTYTIEIQAAPVALQSIAITTPAAKLIYTVGDSLDISGMVVTGTYSDNSTTQEAITLANVTGFDSSAPEASQTLTVTVGGKTTTYTIEIQAAPVIATLVSITTPSAITGVANGTAKTASALGLPSTVTMVTGSGNVQANVTWDVDSCSYNASSTSAQTFTVSGTATLPTGVVNTNNVPLTTGISVAVNAAQAPTYALTIKAGTGGTITEGSSGNYAAGDIISLAVTTNSNYSFNGWTSSNGGTFANANSATTTFAMPMCATALTATFTYNGGSGGGGGSGNSSGGSIPSSGGTSVSGSVVDGTTGATVSNLTGTVMTDRNGNYTVSMQASQTVTLQQPDGTTSPLSDLTKVSYESAGGALLSASANGTINFANLAKGTDNQYKITYDLGNGQTITLGTMEVIVSNDGTVSLKCTLIDPYGIITDAATGKPIAGAKVTLYYANTERNKTNGKIPDNVVTLPSINGFKPNNNQNPQTSDGNGAYGFMVFPDTDYYIVASKGGYESYTSPTISVGQDIVHWDFKMSIPIMEVNRLAGQSQVDTALAIAKANYTGMLSNVVLTTADNYQDALAGSVLAYKLNAPILLVGSSETDQAKALDYMKLNLDPLGNVYLLGGIAAVSADMEAKIKADGFSKITRLGGTDGNDTCVKITDQLQAKSGTPIVLVNGENYPDVLSISSIAAENQYPILLVQKDGISDGVKNEIAAIKPSKVYIIGGEGVISSAVESQVEQVTSLDKANIVRIAGQDRYDTSLAVAQYFNLSGQSVCITTGNNFQDALAGSVYAANHNTPIILADGSLSDQVVNYLKSKKLTGATLFGGEAVVGKSIEQQLNQLIGK